MLPYEWVVRAMFPVASQGRSVRIFLDTEYTDLLNCDLLSVGLVSEEGVEFYAERSDADLGLCSDFTRVAVLPQRGQDPAVVCTEEELARRLNVWLEQFKPYASVVVSVDHPTDWELFTYLVRDADTLRTPSWLRGESIRAAIDPACIERYWRLHGRRAHHALHDAKANRYAFLESGLAKNDRSDSDR
jgi:hypothetical protein